MTDIKKRWHIEVGPVQPPPGPGDGSDAAFEIVEFVGTRSQADAEASRLCDQWQARYLDPDGSEDYPCYHPDIGLFGVGAAVVALSEK